MGGPPCTHDDTGRGNRLRVKPHEPVRLRQQPVKLPAFLSAQLTFVRHDAGS